MPGMPDLIVKAPVMNRMETFTKNKANASSPKLANAITALGADPTLPNNKLAKIAKDLGLYADDNATAHFRQDWLKEDPSKPSFWPDLKNIETIIRQGMLEICKQFQQSKLPCEFFWVMSGEQGTADFQMSVSKGTQQITVMFHTPMVPCPVPTGPSPSTWVVLEEADINGVVSVVTRPAQVPIP